MCAADIAKTKALFCCPDQRFLTDFDPTLGAMENRLGATHKDNQGHNAHAATKDRKDKPGPNAIRDKEYTNSDENQNEQH